MLWFTIVLVSALMTFSITLKDTFRQYFTINANETYLDIDFMMTYDQNSSSRISNIREIRDDYSGYFDSVSSYMNLYTMIEHGGKSSYVNVLSSSQIELRNVTLIEIGLIGAGDMVVTESYAEKNGLTVGDQVKLSIADQTLDYLIIAIVEEKGIFSGDTVFVLKERITQTMFGFSGLSNLGNKVYFDVGDEYEIQTVIDILKLSPTYQDNEFIRTLDLDKIERQATFNASIFIGLGLMAVIALVLVLQSIFPLIYKDLAKSSGVVQTLGGKSSFVFHVWMIEVALILVTALPAGVLLSWFVFNQGLQVVGINGNVSFRPLLVIISMAILTTFILADVGFHYHRMQQQSVSKRLNPLRFIKKYNSWFSTFILVFLLILQWMIHPFSRPVNAIVFIFLSLFLTFSAIGWIMTLPLSINRIFKKRDYSTLITYRQLASNKIMHNTVKIVMASFMVIGISLMINHQVDTAIDDFRNEMKVDYYLTNIFDYQPQILSDILSDPITEYASEGVLYQNVIIKSAEDPDKTIQFMLSVAYDDLDKFFNYRFDDEIGTAFKDSSQLYVALPVAYSFIYNIRAGDTVTFSINHDLTGVEAIVAGFIDTNYVGLVLSNLSVVTEYSDRVDVNTVVITTKEDQNYSTDLLKAYSSRMYYFLDANSLMDERSDFYQDIADYLLLIGWGVVVCFMGIIFNSAIQLFDQNKSDFAKIKVLGLGKKELRRHFFIEWGFISAIAGIFALLNLVVIIPRMADMMLLFDNYHIIEFDWTMFTVAMLLGVPCFLISYMVYYHRIKVHPLIDELKQY